MINAATRRYFAVMFKAIFSKQIEIEATAEEVWNILTNFPNYTAWNTFTKNTEIDFVPGGKVKLEVYFDPDKPPVIHRAQISKLQEGKMFAWRMNWGLLLKAERSQEVISRSGNRCVYQTIDMNKGLLAPVVQAFYGKKIERGFERLARDLKQEAEKKGHD